MDITETGWNVLKTRSRQEKVVEKCLVKKMIKVYLPKLVQPKQWKSRKTVVESPLFPGYVFVKPRKEQLYELNYIPGTCGLVVHGSTLGIVQEKELAAIRMVLAADVPFDMHAQVVPGTRVKVIVGPLAGVEGALVSLRNRHRLVINAEILGQAVSVEINRNQIYCI